MIPLSNFIDKIVTNNRWFRIKTYTKNNEEFELGSSAIYSFYNNIMIEKILSQNFKKIELKVSYKFNITHGHEFVNNESIALIDLYNLNNRVYVKNATLILYKKNINFESMVLENLFEFKDTNFKLICLEREMIKINKNNRNRPFKVKNISVSPNSCYIHGKNYQLNKHINDNYENYKFDTLTPMYISIQLCFCNKSYQRMEIISNNIFKSLLDFSKTIGDINKILYNKNKDDLQYLKKYMLEYNHSYKNNNSDILFDIKSEKLSKLLLQYNHNIVVFKNKSDFFKYTSVILKLSKFIKNNEKDGGQECLKFYKLIKLFIDESKKKYYEDREFRKQINTDFGSIIVDHFREDVIKKIDFDDYSIIVIFNFNKKLNLKFKFWHLLYTEEFENEIEKRLYSFS